MSGVGAESVKDGVKHSASPFCAGNVSFPRPSGADSIHGLVSSEDPITTTTSSTTSLVPLTPNGSSEPAVYEDASGVFVFDGIVEDENEEEMVEVGEDGDDNWNWLGWEEGELGS